MAAHVLADTAHLQAHTHKGRMNMLSVCVASAFPSLSLSHSHTFLSVSLSLILPKHAHTQRSKHDLQAQLFTSPIETAIPTLFHCSGVALTYRNSTATQFHVVAVFKSPACITNTNAQCDLLSTHPSSSSQSPALAALTTVAMATKEQTHHCGN